MIDKELCGACGGKRHDLYEPLKYSGVHRKWLCAACFHDMSTPVPAGNR